MHATRAFRRRSIYTNMTPLIDMSFLLITFFVMTLRLGLSQDEKIELPNADQARTRQEGNVVILSLDIDSRGRVLLAGRAWELAALEGELRERRAGDETIKVVLRADARSPFEKVQRVMRTVAQAGIGKVSLAALKLGDSS